MDGWMNGWVDRWVEESTIGWMSMRKHYVCVNERENRGWIDGKMDRWIEG